MSDRTELEANWELQPMRDHFADNSYKITCPVFEPEESWIVGFPQILYWVIVAVLTIALAFLLV